MAMVNSTISIHISPYLPSTAQQEFQRWHSKGNSDDQIYQTWSLTRFSGVSLPGFQASAVGPSNSKTSQNFRNMSSGIRNKNTKCQFQTCDQKRPKCPAKALAARCAVPCVRHLCLNYLPAWLQQSFAVSQGLPAEFRRNIYLTCKSTQ